MTRAQRAEAIGRSILVLFGVIALCAILSLGCGDVLSHPYECPSPALLMTAECNHNPDCAALAKTQTVEYTYPAGEYRDACAACIWTTPDLKPVLTSAGPTSMDCTFIFEGLQTCDLNGLQCRRAVDVTYRFVSP